MGPHLDTVCTIHDLERQHRLAEASRVHRLLATSQTSIPGHGASRCADPGNGLAQAYRRDQPSPHRRHWPFFVTSVARPYGSGLDPPALR